MLRKLLRLLGRDHDCRNCGHNVEDHEHYYRSIVAKGYCSRLGCTCRCYK